MKPVDLTKFVKNVNKTLGIKVGFHDPTVWLDTGNYALNKMISGSFFKGVPLGKVTVFAGESGAGKSYLASANLVKSAQKENILVVLLDSEFAIDKAWLEALGVDTSEDKLIRFPVSLVDDCATIVNSFMDEYTAAMENVPIEEQQGVLFVIDSLGMLSTPTEKEQFEAGNMKGDMGRKAKQLKAFVTQCLKMFGPYKVGLVATNHTYKSQDMFNPDDVISGGSGFIFASSIIIAMQKLKLKEDEDGNKTSQVYGIRSKMKVVKSRYSKPFEEVEVKIPYSTGMDPYSGLFDMFESQGFIKKDGNRYTYRSKTGEDFKAYRKEYGPEIFTKIMMERDVDDKEELVGVGNDLEDITIVE